MKVVESAGCVVVGSGWWCVVVGGWGLFKVGANQVVKEFG